LPPGTYADDVLLSPGCYKIRYLDTVSTTTPNSGNDGISWWANPTQGTGYFRVRVNGLLKLIANPDFGGFFEHSFYISHANNIDEVEKTRTLSIYPNPTSSHLNVNFYGFENDEVTVDVINETGSLMASEVFFNDKLNLNKRLLPIEFLSSGVYFVRIIDEGAVKVSKFVKH